MYIPPACIIMFYFPQITSKIKLSPTFSLYNRILLSMLPLGIAYIFLWYVPGITQQPLNFTYYVCLYFAVQSLLTVELF